ncbi:hypothetical protein FHS85_002026 [Rhodoligotrophos appendicifer]
MTQSSSALLVPAKSLRCILLRPVLYPRTVAARGDAAASMTGRG